MLDGMSATTFIDRILDPVTEALTPQVASVLVGLRADAELQAHIEELREKANRGMLTPEEDTAYKEIVEAMDVIAILQAKARRYLDQHPA